MPSTAQPRRGPGFTWGVVVPIVAGGLLAVGLAMAVCFVAAIAYGDGDTVAFGGSAAIVVPLALAGLLGGRRLPSESFAARDGFFAVTIAWIAASIAGSVPFLLAGTFDTPTDAFFEAMSGFTTTGATLISDVQAEPNAMLLWRSLMQWLGGIGIVVLVVAVAPATGLVTQRIFYAETSGVTPERLTPRIANTAKIIVGIYLALTAAGFVAYLIAGMGPFDAINHILTTIATGGFSTRNTSIASFNSLPIELVAIAFMTLGGINFAFYWRAMKGKPLGPQFAEVRAYLLILGGASLAVTVSLLIAGNVDRGFDGLRQGVFTVVSLMTTTGYTTADFDGWNSFARVGLLALMFVGACAGSTAGGMKVIRTMMLARTASQEVERPVQPATVQVLRIGGRPYGEHVRRGVLGFFYIYSTAFIVGTIVMATTGLDPVSAASSVAATLNVTGPGLGDVGGIENYASVSNGGLWVLSAMMLIGRLEVFTVVVLLTPAFWRRGG